MENENQVTEATTSEEVVETTTEETVPTPKTYSEEEFKQVVARAKKAETEAKALKNQPPKTINKSLGVDDIVSISASLEGLDQKEKEKLAREHQLTGKPLADIRKDEDFLLWQSAYRTKAEKERTSLTPSSKQPDDNSPISLEDALANAKTDEEREELLKTSLGYSIGNKHRADKVNIR